MRKNFLAFDNSYNREVVVEKKFCFNFHENRGEVKIEREWRQKCSLAENYSEENGASQYVYPDLVDEEGARWVMTRLR